MTTPKEALERAREALCSHFGPGRYRVNFPYIDEALASLQGEDAVERVARIIEPRAFENWQGLYDYGKEDNEEYRRRRADYFHKADCYEAIAKARAILATGLVADEAAAKDEDEAYEIGKRDGYESAIQDLDIATGGDGEFKGSTIPGQTVDVPAMKQRIIDQFKSAHWREVEMWRLTDHRDIVERLRDPRFIGQEAMREEAADEIERLRKVACDCAAAIGNCAALSPESSLNFIELLPGEIAKHTDKLRRFLKCARDEGTEALDRAAAAESELSTLRARVREVVGPFARADRAIGSEPGPFRFETGTGHRLIERGDLAAASRFMEELK